MSAIGMPGHLLALFAPRPPLEYVAPKPRSEHKPFVGLGEFTSMFETTPPPAVEPFEAPKDRRARLKREKAEKYQEELKIKISEFDPHKDDAKVKTADPRRTLFVGRLSYETSEKKLLKTFEQYGQIRDIRLVTNQQGKPRGYAFIEFKSTEGLRTAYREANDRLLDGRKIVVDTERARTIEKWLPRRLGGGEGPPRCGVPKKVLQQRAMERRVAANAPTRGRDFAGRGRGVRRDFNNDRPSNYRGRGRPSNEMGDSRGPPPRRRWTSDTPQSANDRAPYRRPAI